MDFIERALILASKGLGKTSPNPLVGAVLVRQGKIVGEGYHQRAGGDHAEIAALKKAGSQARGAVLYINLEPCCHWGRTPPCTQALIRAGVREVHMSILDPNPLVAGRGRQELEKAGIITFVGERALQARRLNEVYLKYIETNLPFVAVKWAMTLDGKIATITGESYWISNKQSRNLAQQLRCQYDAVLVGLNTVLKDNPRLTVRLKGVKRQPVKIILDSQARLPLSAKVLQPTRRSQTIVAVTKQAPLAKREALQRKGAKVILVKSKKSRVSLVDLIKKLGQQGIRSVLIEGGSEVLASAFQAKLVDKIYIFIAPKIIGGQTAKTPVAGQGVSRIKQALNWYLAEIKTINGDLFISAYPKK